MQTFKEELDTLISSITAIDLILKDMVDNIPRQGNIPIMNDVDYRNEKKYKKMRRESINDLKNLLSKFEDSKPKEIDNKELLMESTNEETNS